MGGVAIGVGASVGRSWGKCERMWLLLGFPTNRSVTAHRPSFACRGVSCEFGLPPQEMNGEGVTDHHNNHRDVEGAEGAEDEEGLVVDGAHVVSGHDVGGVDNTKHGDDGGDQHRQQPHQHHLHAHGLHK